MRLLLWLSLLVPASCFACEWSDSKRSLAADKWIALNCSIQDRVPPWTIHWNISSPRGTLLDVALLDEQNYRKFIVDATWDCLNESLCFFDVSGACGTLTQSSVNGSALYFIVSNENLFQTVVLAYDVVISVAGPKDASEAGLALLGAGTIVLVVTATAAAAFLLWKKHRANGPLPDVSLIPLDEVALLSDQDSG